MSNIVAVLVAYIICCNGILIFREPKEVGTGPLISCYLFMLAAALLLYDLSVYPQSLRKLGVIFQTIVEVSTYLQKSTKDKLFQRKYVSSHSSQTFIQVNFLLVLPKYHKLTGGASNNYFCLTHTNTRFHECCRVGIAI